MTVAPLFIDDVCVFVFVGSY